MKRHWWLGALALVVAGCGGDGNGSSGGNGGGNPLPGMLVLAVTDDNRIVAFNSSDPSRLLQQYTISGLAANDRIVGIDFNALNPSGAFAVTESGNLYLVNNAPNDANPTVVEAALIGNVQTNNDVGELDYDPTTNSLRVVTGNNGNLDVSIASPPITTTTRTAFAYDDGTVGDIEGLAYTYNTQNPTSTVLYGIDVEQNALVRVPTPNAGLLSRVGDLGFNVSGPVAFDLNPLDANVGVIAQTENGRSRIYTVNTTNGSTVRGGLTPQGVNLLALTVAPEGP